MGWWTLWRLGCALLLCRCVFSESVQVLSLDGGGIRGEVSATILQILERDTGLDACKDFQLIIGTSTGSIIASMLALGIPPAKIVHYYEEMGKLVFSDGGYSIFHSKYDPHKLKQCIEDVFDAHGISKDIKLSDLNTWIVIPVVHLNSKSGKWALRFRENVTGNNDCSVSDAIIEGVATPTFFPICNKFADCGLIMNDPALAGLVFANKIGRNCTGIKILSIGTGYVPFEDEDDGNTSSECYDWGIVQWISPGKGTASPLWEMLEAAHPIYGEICAQMLGGSYLRLNVPLPQEYIKIDDCSIVQELKKLAEEYITGEETNGLASEWINENIKSEFGVPTRKPLKKL